MARRTKRPATHNPRVYSKRPDKSLKDARRKTSVPFGGRASSPNVGLQLGAETAREARNLRRRLANLEKNLNRMAAAYDKSITRAAIDSKVAYQVDAIAAAQASALLRKKNVSSVDEYRKNMERARELLETSKYKDVNFATLRANTVIAEEVNRASYGDEATVMGARGPLFATIFFMRTKDIWQGGPHDARYQRVMEYYGVKKLETAFKRVFSAKDEGLTGYEIIDEMLRIRAKMRAGQKITEDEDAFYRRHSDVRDEIDYAERKLGMTFV